MIPCSLLQAGNSWSCAVWMKYRCPVLTRNTQLCGKYMEKKVLERGKNSEFFSFFYFDDINFRFSAGDKFSLLIFEGVTSWQDP